VGIFTLADTTLYILKADPPHLTGIKKARGFVRGDIVSILPMGKWPGDFVHPTHINSKKKWYLIHVLGLDAAKAQKYKTPDYVDTGVLDRDGLPIYRMRAKRKFRIPVDEIPQHIKDELRDTHETTVTKTQLVNFIKNKVLG